jgi:hypothetical protein
VIRRFFVTILPALIVLGILIYRGDYAMLRMKHDPYGSITVHQYYAVKLKNKQTEFMFQPPAPQECVNSAFPHSGDLPCWYLKNHTRQRIDIDSSAFHFWAQ